MSNLPFTLGYPPETGANTEYDPAMHVVGCKVLAVEDELAAYQLVGGVMAYQGVDG